ncbi:MAG: class I SAM-dependent methyltransferase [Ruminococcaceae bacterium]|nr:class I SAM-dependent methyltransferase [Oscillospiraceae bacterium]
MNGCEGYEAIASVYDRLNREIDYEAWADFFEECFTEHLAEKPKLILDLACGTGRMTRTLADRGYDMIGVDGSEEMLSEAASAEWEREDPRETPILYLCQDMRSFELYGTVGAAVCCLDSLNYLPAEADLEKTFRLLHNYLDPHGLFLFDVNTPYKFETVYGDNAYILEDEDGDGRSIFCGWQNAYDPANGVCDFYLTLFREEDDGSYIRTEEHQREYCYSKGTLFRLLIDCGFEVVGCYGGYDRAEPAKTAERWYIAAKKK